MESNDLTSEQSAAIDSICDWYKSIIAGSGKRFFKLGGLAGTGKTTILPFVVQRMGIPEDNVAFVAYTGKAARVMKLKGAERASTIHRLIYSPEEDKTDVTAAISFVKKRVLSESTSLIIVDEASMVSEEIHKDLLSFNIPVIYVGDYFQLQPIDGDFSLMKESKLDAKLSMIHRQAEGNPIIQVAMAIRDGSRIMRKDRENRFIRMYQDDVPNSTLVNADQIITGKNVVRQEMNAIVRKLKGFNSDIPLKEDRIIFLRNNYFLGIMNGQQMILSEDSSVLDVLTLNVKCVEDWAWDEYSKLEKELGKETVDIAQLLSVPVTDGVEVKHLPIAMRSFKNPGYAETLHEFSDRLLADYAYAITVHKAQGSEWDKVILWDDGFAYNDENTRRRWLYTAITRASSRLIWAEQ
jgi:exodeoxyribonuclease-5